MEAFDQIPPLQAIFFYEHKLHCGRKKAKTTTITFYFTALYSRVSLEALLLRILEEIAPC